MKQCITVEQVWELSKETGIDGEPEWDSIVNFNALMGYEWELSPEEQGTYSFQSCCEDTAKWTTIGKMIEILAEELIEINNNGNHYEIAIELNGIRLYAEKDLVDALWEAVKYILRESD